MRKKGIALEHGVHRALVRRDIRDVLAVDADLALVCLSETGQQTEHCGLSAARRAEDGDEFALLDIDAYIVKDALVAETL